MNVTLYCNVSAFIASFGWERRTDGSAWIGIRNTQRPYYVMRNIQQTERYRCITGNDAGSVLSNAATIEVLSKCIICD